jgi:CBS domain containing-hemolysin-like protein
MLFVPQSARLDQVLDVFRSRHRYAALAVDEAGEVVGLIEIDDVLRHLIGEPAESADTPGPGVEPAGDGRWVVAGRLPVRDLTDVLDPAGTGTITVRGRPIGPRVSTVGGLLLLALGRVPRIGDAVRFGNVTLHVESMRGRAVDRVAIELEPFVGPQRPASPPPTEAAA